jgi:hypothetical protein
MKKLILPELRQVAERFSEDLDRVQGILSMYQSTAKGKQGRRATASSDLLRSAIVFLHAAVEDLIRGIAYSRLPQADPKFFEDLPLGGEKPKFSLQQLARYRGKTVNEVIAISVEDFLENSTFNNLGDIKRLLIRCGADLADVEKRFRPLSNKIGPLIMRRHQIVHRLDRNPRSGSGHHIARSISSSTLRRWLGAGKRFGKAVLALF